jgi:hypothetical protein
MASICCQRFESENTYKELFGPLSRLPALWAKCVFADPVSDGHNLSPAKLCCDTQQFLIKSPQSETVPQRTIVVEELSVRA